MPSNPIWYGETDAALDRIYGQRHRKNQHTAIAIALIFAAGWIGYGWMTKPLPIRMHFKNVADGIFMFDAVADSARFCRIDDEDVWCSNWSVEEALDAALP